MSWIETVPAERAEGKLKGLYARVAGPEGQVDQIMRVHSLRPHTMEGHLSLYKNVLHHGGNRLPRAWLETLGVYVSELNGCDYCVAHHLAGLKRLLGDQVRAEEIQDALTREAFEDFDARERATLRYARALTLAPAGVARSHVEAMREAGLDDGEILEVNQVVSYFAYANRTALGLGVTTAGETLGLSPNDAADPNDWRHR